MDNITICTGLLEIIIDDERDVTFYENERYESFLTTFDGLEEFIKFLEDSAKVAKLLLEIEKVSK